MRCPGSLGPTASTPSHPRRTPEGASGCTRPHSLGWPGKCRLLGGPHLPKTLQPPYHHPLHEKLGLHCLVSCILSPYTASCFSPLQE